MTTLNRAASEIMLEVGVNASKDVTGFGLLGHACEMIQGTKVGFEINAAAVPVFPEAKEYYDMGMVAGGLMRNRDFRKNMVDFDPALPQFLQDILFDPQTSGGLLISVPASKAPTLLKKLHSRGAKAAAIIGKVVGEHKGRIKVS
jgi:selenide,water dikinase